MRDPEGAWGFSPTKNAPLIEGRALAPGLPLMNAANRKGPRIGVPGKLARWGEGRGPRRALLAGVRMGGQAPRANRSPPQP
jgi:hypothetical protein